MFTPHLRITPADLDVRVPQPQLVEGAGLLVEHWDLTVDKIGICLANEY
jgi:hypothetical protein